MTTPIFVLTEPWELILTMLPDYRVVELWPDDVLLENRAFEDPGLGTP